MLFFLDIDGVMVPAKGWKCPELLHDGFPVFSIRATRTLQRLVAATDTIMLTTSHKSTYSIEAWKRIFRNRGINIENLAVLPENVHHLSRKDEIVHWFNVHNVDENFVIIDDDKSLNELPAFLRDKLVQTSSYIGLTEEYITAIQSISIQNPQPAL